MIFAEKKRDFTMVIIMLTLMQALEYWGKATLRLANGEYFLLEAARTINPVQ